jgi:putative copper resistance protein D
VTADLTRALLAWPLAVSLVVTFGTTGFVLLSAVDRIFDLQATTASLVGLWQFLAAVVFLVSPLVLLNMTADMAGDSWIQAVSLMPQVLAETHAGHVFEWFLPISLLLLVNTVIPVPQSLRAAILFVSAGLLLLLQALMSHAIDKGTLAVTAYFVHEVSAGLWVGALLALWIVARYGRPPDIWVERAARRVSSLAFWSVIGLIVTGTYTAYNALGFDVYHLMFSTYGRTLMAKVSVFAGVVAIGAYNRYRLVPAVEAAPVRRLLLRNVTLESVLLIGVLGLATLLANTPPPHGTGGNSAHSTMAM